MKKLVLLLSLSICNLIYSQETFRNIIDGFTTNEKKCLITLKSRGKFILGKGFTNEKQNNDITSIYTSNGLKTSFLLSNVGSYGRFRLYFFDYVENLKLQLNTCQTTDGGSDFILTDTQNGSIYYMESYSGISICKFDKNLITYQFSLKNFSGKLIKLDNKMMPISSIELKSKNDEILDVKLVNYNKNQESFSKNIKYYNTQSQNLFDMQYDDLLEFLSTKLQNFDSAEKCAEKYCDSNISRFFMEIR